MGSTFGCCASLGVISSASNIEYLSEDTLRDFYYSRRSVNFEFFICRCRNSAFLANFRKKLYPTVDRGLFDTGVCVYKNLG